MKKNIYLFIFLASTLGIIILLNKGFKQISLPNREKPAAKITSIDTMKYSRDPSREKINDPSFDAVIDQQMKQIAATGATHVAIGTPYDEEFDPILKRWVKYARKYKLKVWFRGNFSGWEEWFNYPRIDRSTHIVKTIQFIFRNNELFQDGDIFTACSECENGGPGDPRQTGDVDGHRQFLIDEYKATKNAFKKINKDVASNYDSMNGDVARLIMDKTTTKALDGIVVVDHYVEKPTDLASDLQQIAQNSGGEVVLGEFGAPIPDIHGTMTEEQQAKWLDDVLSKLMDMKEVAGLNYWTSYGGSTQLWNDDGTARNAVKTITKYYKDNKKLVTLPIP